MHFLPDIEVPWDVCTGQRFNLETLEVRHRGKTIGDVLAMTVAEARDLVQAHPQVRRGPDLLVEVGLGYVSFGPPATTPSGGKAQRVKLATELVRRPTGRTIYLLDEPTTGLHAEDVACLLGILEALVARGNTVLLVEHNLDMLKRCDWLLELGPDGGADGGRVVAEGLSGWSPPPPAAPPAPTWPRPSPMGMAPRPSGRPATPSQNEPNGVGRAGASLCGRAASGSSCRPTHRCCWRRRAPSSSRSWRRGDARP